MPKCLKRINYILNSQILKIYDIESVKGIITIHILRKISRSKENQAMKFGQLIVLYTRNISLKKPYTNYIYIYIYIFFLSGFSFTNIHDSWDSRGRGRVSI